MWNDFLIAGAVGVPISLISEFLLPGIFGKTPKAKRQTHFFAILLMVFAFSMTLTIKASFEARQHIKAVEDVFSAITDPHLKEHFRGIFTAYQLNLTKRPHSHLLVHWVQGAMASLRTQIDATSVSLPSSEATQELRDLYSSATEYIFVTHVGHVGRNGAESDLYEGAMLNWSKRRFPVIGLYFFDYQVASEEQIMTDGGADPDPLTAYHAQVEQVHMLTGSLMSIVVAGGGGERESMRQLLVADGKLLVEAEFHERRAHLTGILRATGNVDDISSARSHLLRLLGTLGTSDRIFRLEDDEVEARFARYARRPGVKADRGSSGESLAMAVAKYLLSTDEGSES